MEYFINCNTSPLTPYAGALNQQQVDHLYRRLGFSASVQTINEGIGQTANVLVDTLINQATNSAPIPAPAWANWNDSNYPADDDLRRQITRQQKED